MLSRTVVIAQIDPTIAMELANDLHAYFARVVVAASAQELRTMLLRHEAGVAVLDLEVVNLEEIRSLSCTLDDLTIVCTHQSPDEQMWITALNAGSRGILPPSGYPLHTASIACSADAPDGDGRLLETLLPASESARRINPRRLRQVIVRRIDNKGQLPTGYEPEDNVLLPSLATEC